MEKYVPSLNMWKQNKKDNPTTWEIKNSFKINNIEKLIISIRILQKLIKSLIKRLF